MSANRTEQIAAVIEKRRPLVAHVERVLENLKVLDGSIRELEATREQVSAQADGTCAAGCATLTSVPYACASMTRCKRSHA
jgi:hypothetical protein